jgi:hypothetical protein
MAGIAFLNLSFILAEISALDLSKKYKSLVQLVTNAGLEEEKEIGGEAGESDSSEEVDIIHLQISHYQIPGAETASWKKHWSTPSVRPGHIEKFTPPPDGASFIS